MTKANDLLTLRYTWNSLFLTTTPWPNTCFFYLILYKTKRSLHFRIPLTNITSFCYQFFEMILNHRPQTFTLSFNWWRTHSPKALNTCRRIKSIRNNEWIISRFRGMKVARSHRRSRRKGWWTTYRSFKGIR